MASDVPGVILMGDAHVQGGALGQAGILSLMQRDYNPDNDIIPGFLPNVRAALADCGEKDVYKVTPIDLQGNLMANASGAHIWFDDAVASGVQYNVASSTTTSITLSSAVLTSGAHLNQRISLINIDHPEIGGATFSGTYFDDIIACTGNTDQTLFFSALSAAPQLGQGFWIGEGLFRDYHPVGGFTTAAEATAGGVASRGGSSPAQGGHGIGPDSTMVPDFFNKVWNTAPYFKMFKWPVLNTVCEGWGDSPNDAARAAFLTQIARVEAAAADRGDTIKWEVVVIDFSMRDLSDGTEADRLARIVFYQSRLQEMITWLRSASVCNNSDLKVILVNHRADMWATTAQSSGVLGAPFYRQFHRNVAALDDKVGIVDMADQTVGWSNNDASDENKYYSQAGYFYYGREAVKVYQRLAAGASTSVNGGMPTYIMLGDSIFTGEIVSQWTTLSVQDELSGPNFGVNLKRPSNQMVWNRGNLIIEVYEPHTNSNTSGSSTATAGPDLSIMAELGKKHPNGFVMIKRASSSSALSTAAAPFSGVAGLETGGRWMPAHNEHWPELIDDVSNAYAYMNDTLGKQADLRGIFVSLGHNDHTAGGGAAFASNLLTFCNNLESQFGTRNYDGFAAAPRTPIIWRRPQTEAVNVNLTEMALVRDAIETLDANYSWFSYINMDGQPRDHGDDLHEAPETAVWEGRNMVAILSGQAF